MECNKEEAFRAREIAERRMQNKDFTGAHKIAQKAQRLYPELENISQILTVCEVHCSADVKIDGLMDWYGILQVEPTADDSSIKKQYRKLALLLHPDKNQFPGAEAAFKLIGEAHMFLSDLSRRRIYDIRRDATKHVPSNQSTAQTGTNSVRRNFNAGQSSGLNQQQQQPSQFSDSLTFWTSCPDCSIRYQYFRSILNKTIRCQNCLKPFVAYVLNEKSVPCRGNLGQSMDSVGNLHQQIPAQQTNQSKQQSGIDSSGMGFKERVGGGPKIHFEHGGGPANVATNDKLRASKEVKFEEGNPGEMNQGELATKPPTTNVNRNADRKVAVEPRDSASSGVKNTAKEDGCQTKHSSASAATRRSTRLKQNNNHNEVRSENDDDDCTNPQKKLRESSGGNNSHEAGANFVTSRSNSADVRMEDSHREGDPSQKTVPDGSEGVNRDSIGENKQEPMAGEKSERGSKSRIDSTSNGLPESQTFTYPDSEFGNFEESRHLNEFAVDQIWAVYDDLDGMPRFYARIRNIYVPHAKVKFTWLEHNPLNEAEIAWSDAKLPVGFGNYLLGSSHVSEDLLMFSHVIPWEKGKKRSSYVVYPRKGEVWALFKDWNFRWTSDAENRLLEYEVVEVLSEFKPGTGICVTRLIRIEGFVSLFMQMKDKPFVIPPDEVLRFSHNIPSYRLTGTEKEGIPQGCMELDPASLPANFAESFPSIRLGNSVGKESSRSCLNSTTVEEEPGIRRAHEMETKVGQNLFPDDVKGVDDSKKHQASEKQHSDAWRYSQIYAEQAEAGISQKDYLDAMDTHDDATEKGKVSSLSTLSHLTCPCPEIEFHNFDEGKSVENVQQGQIWALFTNIDKYPKYYAWVKEVNLEEFRVQMSWLEACPVFEEEIRWLQESMPVTCGTFKVEQESMIVDKIGMFSHLVQPKIARRNRYVILPSQGEVWAIYKNWTAGWSYSDLENCEYDVVEICECADVAMKVRPLKKVNGYRAVFKPETQDKSMTLEIPIDEYTRFSHKIPAFLLTNQGEGKLRGYWELDVASVPEFLLLSNAA